MANIIVRLFIASLKPIILLIFVVALLPFVPNAPPDYKFTSFTAPDPPSLEGKLALNKLLNSAERLFEGEIFGPEAFTILNGELYTSLIGGFVGKVVSENKIKPIVKFGVPCEDRFEEAKCGRPLGLFAVDNLLYVADAYYGIFKYDVDTKQSTKIIGPDNNVAGRKPKIFNSIAVASDGTIYWSDSSSDVTLQDGFYALLADGSGRLIQYNPQTKKHTVLIDGLMFANGVALAADESFVLVAETGMARIHRYWLKGSLAGSTDIFIDSLPGLPDNIRTGSQGFLISLVAANDKDTPVLTNALYPFPYVRKAIARALTILEVTLTGINRFYPNTFCKKGVFYIGHFESTRHLVPPRVTLIVTSINGDVVESFHATDGSVHAISDAIVHRGQLYLGSPYNNYLGRIRDPEVVARFQKAFPPLLKVAIRLKPTTATPNPETTPPPRTTTTPKPTTTTTTTTTPPPPRTTTTPKPTTTTTTTTPPPPRTTTTPKPATTTTPPPPPSRPTTPKPAASSKTEESRAGRENNVRDANEL